MNDEPLAHVGAVLGELKRRHNCRAIINTRKRSVLGMLRDASRTSDPGSGPRYDFIYCAGLFDYLTDAACRQLLKVCWHWLAPGGMVVATKVVKLTRAERHRHLSKLERLYSSPVTPVSAETGEGLDALWTLIARLLKRP